MIIQYELLMVTAICLVRVLINSLYYLSLNRVSKCIQDMIVSIEFLHMIYKSDLLLSYRIYPLYIYSPYNLPK